ncbi:UDP-glucosyltransferase 2-like [Battus philenor]|uniref:UDP-glucosyltransferase 2-like n=1 Tax=Battus philenor TaxID=42288 RepID=UPI0035CF722D
MKSCLIITLVALTWVSLVSGHHILCVFPTPSRSHSLLGKGIVDSLLDAGHQVTWVTPFPEKNPVKNLKQINVEDARALSNSMNVTTHQKMTMAMIREFARNISLAALNSVELQSALVKEKYDAVVSEWFFSDLEAGYAAVQQVPWIVLNGVVMHPYMEYLVDSVRNLPVLPFMMNDFPVPMNLWQRLANTFSFGVLFVGNWLDESRAVSTYDKYYGPIAAARGVSLPAFAEAKHNISIMFVNSHPSFAPAQVLPPNVIDIAGYHIAENTPPLPRDLQDLLDSSTQGVVYFSMGSVVKSAALPESTKRDLIKLLGDLPYTVLWKFEEKLEGLPKNVHIRPWMPQASILAHRNVKLFITHGGLLSTLESLRYGIPLLAVPVFGDQPGNAARAVRAGYARMVPFSPHMTAQLEVELREMLENDSYYKKSKALSKLFNNRPVSQRKLVSHYVELAIDSKGAYHLRSKSQLYKWYQLWMLDQVAVVLAALYLLYCLVKLTLRSLTRRSVKVDKKKEKKNKSH